MIRLQPAETNWSSDRTKVRVWYPARSVVAHQVTGHLTIEAARVVMTGIDKILEAQAPVIAFNDWYGMEGYDSDARIAMTDYVLGFRLKYAAIHILLRSKLVAMGVSVANMALGGMLVSYTEPHPWKEALQLTVHRREIEDQRARASLLPEPPKPDPPKRDFKR